MFVKNPNDQYINYLNYTSSACESGCIFTSSKPDSLSSIIRNKTFYAEKPIYFSPTYQENSSNKKK